jgi:hypothetical protein
MSPEPDCTCGAETLGHGCRDRGLIVAQDFRPGRGDVALAVEHVLVRQRHTVEEADAPAALERTIRGARRLQGLFAARSI